MTISVTELLSRPTTHSEINFPIFASYDLCHLEISVFAFSSFVLVHSYSNLHVSDVEKCLKIRNKSMISKYQHWTAFNQ